MKAMMFKKYGLPEVLRLTKTAKPTPKANELLVKIVATAVNPADNHLLSGMLRFRSGLIKPKHQIPGSDIAGWVAAVGENVTQFQVGNAVFGDLSEHGNGGLAKYVTVSETAVVHKPTNISFVEAAAVPMTGVTALQGLRNYGHLQPDQQLLINGASGGVGTFAVQIGKALGGEITAVVSSRKSKLIQAIGADHLIDYAVEDFSEREGHFDLIFDMVSNRSITDYRRALKPNGRFVTTTFLPGFVLFTLWSSKAKGKKMVNMLSKPNLEDLTYLANLLETEKIKPVIDRCYPLDKAAAALDYVGKGHASGKVIILVEPH